MSPGMTVASNGSVAKDYEDAVTKAEGCPILHAGGSVEVAEAMDM